jgi:enediyne biosynthesis protein E7
MKYAAIYRAPTAPVAMPSLVLGFDHLKRIGEDPIGFYEKAQRDYGDLIQVRFAHKKHWLVFHPDHLEQILLRQADKFIRDQRLLGVMKQWAGESSFTLEGEAWKARRRSVMTAFRRERLMRYSQAAVEQSIAIRDGWLSDLEASSVITRDTFDATTRYTLRIVFRAILGLDHLNLLDMFHHSIQELLDLGLAEVADVITLPWPVPTRHNRRKRAIIGKLFGTISGLVRARLAGEDQGKDDFLQSLLEALPGNEQAITDELMTLLTAGDDTSGSTLCWLFYSIACNPDILARLQHELDTVLGGRIPGYADLDSMPYLNAAILEATRLYPATYTIPAREAIEDVHLDGFTIRKGEVAQLVPYVTQRDPRWFDHPDEFRPERFMDRPNWPPFAYFTFGRGPRICSGRDFAIMEMSIFTAILFQQLEPLPYRETMKPEAWFLLRPRSRLDLQWRRRLAP